MIVLNTTNTSLELVLAAAITTNQLQYTIHYEILSRQGESTVSQSHGLSNSTTDVTLLAAPSIAGERRIIRGISIYNADTQTATVTVQYDDAGTERIITKATLSSGSSLHYESGTGWTNGTSTTTATSLTNGTTVATTSGTSHDFTVPAWVKRWTILMAGGSVSGTAALRIQLGDADGIENTGYLGASQRSGGAGDNTGTNSTAGADTAIGVTGTTDIMHGRFQGELLDTTTNTWIITHNIAQSNAARASNGAHSKSLSATLTTVRLTTSNGTDTFDAGSANILYE